MSEKEIEKLRVAARDSGFRASWLSAKIGVDRSTLYRFIHGQTRLGRPALMLLAMTLNMKLDEAKKSKAS